MFLPQIGKLYLPTRSVNQLLIQFLAACSPYQATQADHQEAKAIRNSSSAGSTVSNWD
jgi:hypothetical protein